MTSLSEGGVGIFGFADLANFWFGLVFAWLIEGNGYETRQSSLLYVFVPFFGLDGAQNTIVVYSVLRN